MTTPATTMTQGPVSDPTLSDRTDPGETPGEAGWRRLHLHQFEPLFVADWERAVFLHFSVDPDRLQRWVPFPLDCRDGLAWVSLVAFTMRGMRPGLAGPAGRWLLAPIATHAFLNIRTYVRLENEPGIHFLAEWLPNRLAVALGPRLFGLPYRLGRLYYDHPTEPGHSLSGKVVGAEGGELKYRADLPVGAEFASSERGSVDEFLLERYTAYLAWPGGRRGYFRVWHQPWSQIRIEPKIADCSLLFHAPGGADWAASARFVCAHRATDTKEVSMGRPHFLQS